MLKHKKVIIHSFALFLMVFVYSTHGHAATGLDLSEVCKNAMVAITEQTKEAQDQQEEKDKMAGRTISSSSAFCASAPTLLAHPQIQPSSYYSLDVSTSLVFVLFSSFASYSPVFQVVLPLEKLIPFHQLDEPPVV